MKRRQVQLNNRIMEVLSTVIQTEMRDPCLQMLNVTRVEVNRDVSNAIIFFVSEDDECSQREVTVAINRAKGFLRSVLAETLDLRYTPDLTFRYDRSVQETKRVLALFDQIAEERKRNPPRFDEDVYA